MSNQQVDGIQDIVKQAIRGRLERIQRELEQAMPPKTSPEDAVDYDDYIYVDGLREGLAWAMLAVKTELEKL